MTRYFALLLKGSATSHRATIIKLCRTRWRPPARPGQDARLCT